MNPFAVHCKLTQHCKSTILQESKSCADHISQGLKASPKGIKSFPHKWVSSRVKLKNILQGKKKEEKKKKKKKKRKREKKKKNYKYI